MDERTAELGAAPAGREAGTRRVLVLGSTGSIGSQTIDVLGRLNRLHEAGRWPLRYEIVGLAAGRRAADLSRQADGWRVPLVALRDTDAAAGFTARAALLTGEDAALRLVRETECDLVMAALVGVAGLAPTLAALELGRDVAIANKETLAAAGPLMLDAARRTGARLLPVDSEHAAAWLGIKCAAGPAYTPPTPAPPCVRRLILTASGGAFRDRTRDEVYDAPPETALRHPNWEMGAKVTVDTATMMNKGLELIEARWLFGLPSDRLGVLIHRQSIVHALVELTDGAFAAQLASPDMRIPIQQAITAPHVADAGEDGRLNLAELARLDFAEPDPDRWPAITLARRVIDEDGTAGATLNGANEAAVRAYLDRRLPFGRIVELAADALDAATVHTISSLGDVLDADAAARSFVEARL